MSLTMFQASVPVVTQVLGGLAGVLKKAETSFAGLRARVAKSLEWIATLTPAQIDGSESKEISFGAGTRTLSFPGRQYLLQFCFPHFLFHSTTAYDILRHNGVEIGKRDFVGTF